MEPVLGGVTSRVSQLWSMIPAEYAVPVVLLGAGLWVRREGRKGRGEEVGTSVYCFFIFLFRDCHCFRLFILSLDIAVL